MWEIPRAASVLVAVFMPNVDVNFDVAPETKQTLRARRIDIIFGRS